MSKGWDSQDVQMLHKHTERWSTASVTREREISRDERARPSSWGGKEIRLVGDDVEKL